MKKILAFLLTIASINAQESEFIIQSYKPLELTKHKISFSLFSSKYEKNDSYTLNASYIGLNESEKGWMEWTVAPSFKQYSNSYKDKNVDSVLIFDRTFLEFNEHSSRNILKNSPVLFKTDIRRYLITPLGIQSGFSTIFQYAGSEYKSNNDRVDYYQYSWEKNYVKRVDKSVRRSNIDRKYILINFYMGPVFGRTYEGFYSAKAIEIISELRKSGLLKSEPDFAQMESFAKLIHEEYERYYFDSRLKRIETYDRLLSYLTNENIIENTPLAFAHVTDIYSYGENIDKIGNKRYRDILSGDYDRKYIRPFGFETKLIFFTSYDESLYQQEYFDDNQYIIINYDSNFVEFDNDTSLYLNHEYQVENSGVLNNGIELSLNYYLPINWHWQINTFLIGKINSAGLKDLKFFKEDDHEYIRKYHRGNVDNYSSLGLVTEVQYYVNSRTMFRSTIKFQRSKHDRLYQNIYEKINIETDSTTISDNSNKSNIDLATFRYNGGFIFYIRPELSLSLNFMAEKPFGDTKSRIVGNSIWAGEENVFETDEWNYGFDISLKYTIPWF